MSWTKSITTHVLTGVLAFGGGTLTRQDNTIRTEPQRVLTTAQGQTVTIRKAQVWGSMDKVSLDTLLYIWDSKPRKTDKTLMATKAFCEGGLCPCIMRYEEGMHQRSDWKQYSEFEATSGGLFQVMGFNYTRMTEMKKYNISNWDDLCHDIGKQLDIYDDFMATCYTKAERVNNGKDLIYKAIAAYGGDASRINELSNINYRNYLRFKKMNL